jgi:hypothetical protein
MVLPQQPVTLTVEQVAALNQDLANMRHDINNNLSLVMAAVELIRAKPHMTERMTATLVEQPTKISKSMMNFCTQFEKALDIKRD